MEKAAKAILRYIFREYLKGPTVLYAINRIADLYHADPIEVSNYLTEKKWIREQWVHQNNLVTCRITVAGIEEINPLFINNKLKILISGLVEGGGEKNLTDILQNKIEEYAFALDVVYQLEKLGLITIAHQGGEIQIALTAAGWRFAQKGKPLHTFMAVA
jgi:predicted transcriptional regulator